MRSRKKRKGRKKQRKEKKIRQESGCCGVSDETKAGYRSGPPPGDEPRPRHSSSLHWLTHFSLILVRDLAGSRPWSRRSQGWVLYVVSSVLGKTTVSKATEVYWNWKACTRHTHTHRGRRQQAAAQATLTHWVTRCTHVSHDWLSHCGI